VFNVTMTFLNCIVLSLLLSDVLCQMDPVVPF
jgi:hypothetical protein